MTKRRAQNSILFLTTLGVYLGIVLVGGSPSVLAQAALTPRFELVTEFETEDDLDNKPDDEKAVADYAAVCQEFVRLAEQFVSENPDKFPLGSYSFDYSVINDPVSPLNLRTQPKGVHWGMFDGPLVELGKTFPWSADSDNEKFQVVLERNVDSFSLTTALNQSPDLDSVQAVAFYSSLISRRAAADDPLAVILKRTSVSFSNNRIVVVTRLPRASIDELLAEKQ